MPEEFRSQRILAGFLFVALMASAAFGQGSGFNFQGRLNDGTSPANGRYDLQFRLFDAVVGGNPVGSLLLRPNTVLINGVFSVTLDFGASAFNNPNNVYVEISVRPNGSPNSFTILGPRQQLTVAPIALRAVSATNADHATNSDNATNAQNAVNAQTAVLATNATNATNAATAQNANALGGVAPAGWARLNVPNTGDVLLTGRLQITGDATQARTSNGLAKALIYVSADATIVRCHNGITGASSGTCGFAVTFNSGLDGKYRIDFGFPVNDRFISVTAQQTGSIINGVNIGTGFNLVPSLPNEVLVTTFVTDVEFESSRANNAFMVVVY